MCELLNNCFGIVIYKSDFVLVIFIVGTSDIHWINWQLFALHQMFDAVTNMSVVGKLKNQRAVVG